MRRCISNPAPFNGLMRASAEELMFETREKAYRVFAGVIEGPAGVVLLASAMATNEAKTSEVGSPFCCRLANRSGDSERMLVGEE